MSAWNEDEVIRAAGNAKNVGKGFSAAIKCVTTDNGTLALKVVNFDQKKLWKAKWFRQQYTTEVEMLHKLKHPTICVMHFSKIVGDRGYVALELAAKDIYNVLVDDGCTWASGPSPCLFLLQSCANIAVALDYLHSLGCLHCDNHSMNWLLFPAGDTFVCKLADFGAAMMVSDPPSTRCGHMRLSAPEICEARMQSKPIAQSKAADTFMFGMCLSELIEGVCEPRIYANIKSNDGVMKKCVQGGRPVFSNAARDPAFVQLTQACWEHEASARPSMAKVADELAAMIETRKSDGEAVVPPPSLLGDRRPTSKPPPKAVSKKRDTHSANLYVFDEVISSLQKAVRRSMVEDALYWAAELDRSGQGDWAMDRLLVIASEDMSIGVPALPIFVCNQHDIRKGAPRNSFLARRVILETAATMASLPKCLITNNSCGVSMLFVEERVAQGDRWMLDPPGKTTLAELRRCMTAAREASPAARTSEERAIALLQRIYMEDKKSARDLWTLMLSLTPGRDVIKDAIKALHAKRSIGGDGGQRLRLFQSMLLYTREAYLDHTLMDPDNFPVPAISEAEVDKLYSSGRHPTGIPWYCVDRHNKRGKGGGEDSVYHYGVDTTDWLDATAAERGIDISGWSPEERARSHGPGRRSYRNRTLIPDPRGPEDHTLLTQFFEEGSLVEDEVFPSNPFPRDGEADGPLTFRARAAELYLSIEERYGSLEAKSVRIMDKHRKLIAKERKERKGKKPSAFKGSLQGDEFPSIDGKVAAPASKEVQSNPGEKESAEKVKKKKKKKKSKVQGAW